MSSCLHLRNRPPTGYSLPGLRTRPANAAASSRRAYTAYASPCSFSAPLLYGRYSNKCYSRARNGSRNCAWGQPPPPAAERRPAATQRSVIEWLFSMVPPSGHERTLSNYHRSRRPICPRQSSKLPVFCGEPTPPENVIAIRTDYVKNGVKRVRCPCARPGDRRSRIRRLWLYPRSRERSRPRACTGRIRFRQMPT